MVNNSEIAYAKINSNADVYKNVLILKKNISKKNEKNSKYIPKKSLDEIIFNELKDDSNESIYSKKIKSESKKDYLYSNIIKSENKSEEKNKSDNLERIVKETDKYNLPKLNLYQLEERVEELTRRNIRETHMYTGLEQDRYIQNAQEILRNIRLNSTSKNINYFKKSARFILEDLNDPERIENLTNALMDFQKLAVIKGFETVHLPLFLKQDVNLGDDELAKYQLKLDVQMSYSHYGERFAEKYFDTPFNFCLTYDGELIASVGFIPDKGRILIEQIQGIKGKHKELSPFKWERALVNYAAKWAQEHGIQQVSVVSADNNQWVHKHGHLSAEQGKMLYDVTAKRSGFKRGEDGNYHKFFGNSQESEKVQEEELVEAA